MTYGGSPLRIGIAAFGRTDPLSVLSGTGQTQTCIPIDSIESLLLNRFIFPQNLTESIEFNFPLS